MGYSMDRHGATMGAEQTCLWWWAAPRTWHCTISMPLSGLRDSGTQTILMGCTMCHLRHDCSFISTLRCHCCRLCHFHVSILFSCVASGAFCLCHSGRVTGDHLGSAFITRFRQVCVLLHSVWQDFCTRGDSRCIFCLLDQVPFLSPVGGNPHHFLHHFRLRHFILDMIRCHSGNYIYRYYFLFDCIPAIPLPARHRAVHSSLRTRGHTCASHRNGTTLLPPLVRGIHCGTDRFYSTRFIRLHYLWGAYTFPAVYGGAGIHWYDSCTAYRWYTVILRTFRFLLGLPLGQTIFLLGFCCIESCCRYAFLRLRHLPHRAHCESCVEHSGGTSSGGCAWDRQLVARDYLHVRRRLRFSVDRRTDFLTAHCLFLSSSHRLSSVHLDDFWVVRLFSRFRRLHTLRCWASRVYLSPFSL